MYLIHQSPFGKILRAIRDNPARCSAVGINVRRHQLMAIVIATFFAGVAGVLFVVLERSVFPDLLFWVLSLEIFIMCLLGGWFTFIGPVLGAAITVSLRTFVGAYTEYWTLILGVLLILLIFFLPEGVMGFLLERFRSKPKEIDAGACPCFELKACRNPLKDSWRSARPISWSPKARSWPSSARTVPGRPPSSG